MMLAYPGMSKSQIVDQLTWPEIEFLLEEALAWRRARLFDLAVAYHHPERLNPPKPSGGPVQEGPVDKFSAGLAKLARIMGGGNEDLARRIETRAKATWLMKQIKVQGE